MNNPKTITAYLIKEFSNSLFIFISIFLSLILLMGFIQEIIFFKKLTSNIEVYTLITKLTIFKTPALLIKISPFIFLFTSVFFYLKILSNNEINTIKLSGLSNFYLTIVPAVFSFFIGLIIILIISPVSAELSKYYEIEKNKFSDNENLIVMSNTGMWLKEQKEDGIYIIRTDKIYDQNFEKVNNVTVYKFNKSNHYLERIDGNIATIKNSNEWYIQNAKKHNANSTTKIDYYKYFSQINLDNIKKMFNNSDVLSLWNILDEINKLRKIGYYGQELIITFNKYLSLPFMLFAMSCFSTIFTLRASFKLNYFTYTFLCILIGIILYFLNDLSIAFARSGKIPLILSVWLPVIIIMTISSYSLLRKE